MAGRGRNPAFARLCGASAPASSQAAGDANFNRLAELFQARVPQTLLDAYRRGAGRDADGADTARDDALLRLFLMEKAAYEVTYEMDNRPDWLPIALGSFARLVAGLDPDARS